MKNIKTMIFISVIALTTLLFFACDWFKDDSPPPPVYSYLLIKNELDWDSNIIYIRLGSFGNYELREGIEIKRGEEKLFAFYKTYSNDTIRVRHEKYNVQLQLDGYYERTNNSFNLEAGKTTTVILKQNLNLDSYLECIDP